MRRRRRRSTHTAPTGSTKSERFWHFLHWLPHKWWPSEQIPHTGPSKPALHAPSPVRAPGKHACGKGHSKRFSDSGPSRHHPPMDSTRWPPGHRAPAGQGLHRTPSKLYEPKGHSWQERELPSGSVPASHSEIWSVKGKGWMASWGRQTTLKWYVCRRRPSRTTLSK